MKTPKIAKAMEYLDDDLIVSATKQKTIQTNPAWVKWGSLAACFAIAVIALGAVMPKLFRTTPPLTDHESSTEAGDRSDTQTEAIYEMGYRYQVDEGIFSTYVGGKVIAEEKIGEKIEDVLVTGGWKTEDGEWISTESLQAKVYQIADIPPEVAAALIFADKGDALTTTHYYVILNPEADLSAVEEYIILPIVPNNPGDEMAGEPEAE